jgi:Lipid A 3-O-deacylase (PagL)
MAFSQSSFLSRSWVLPLFVFLGSSLSIAQAQSLATTYVPEMSGGDRDGFRADLDKSVGASESSSVPAASAIFRVPRPYVATHSPRYGGTHEFAVTAGISRMSGHWLGYRRDVDVEVINLRYSRVMKIDPHVTISYSTEVTPYINLEEPLYNLNDMGPVEISRKQTVGGGVTPVGFSFDFFPGHRIQPFWRCNYGVLYFHDRVLSPEGSQFMHTVDFGVGFHIYQTRTVSTTLGFRYIHMSNANIADHNPGTDAETFYIGFSRFHSPANRRVE